MSHEARIAPTKPARRAAGVLAVVGVLLVASLLSPVPVSAATPIGGANAVFTRMSEAQRIGQLFMVGDPASSADRATLSLISRYHVGSVILTGRSARGVAATRSVTDALQSRATTSATLGVPLLVATDQEGGEVQVLSGPGFSTIPQGLTQGTWSTSSLQNHARTWGEQLRSAGVNVDLAPVMDTVPSGADNPPIGGFNREYGHTTGVVASHGTAFARGLGQAGVIATVKHFPGLGRVTANTDTSSGVTDGVTTRHDAYLGPFATAIGAGAPFAMMSTAYYRRLDASHPAAFSSTIIGGILRRQLGFAGVVVSDDLGASRQVSSWSPGARAVDFINAGGDLVLSVTPSVVPAMVQAVADAVAAHPSFRAKVDAAARLVLLAKQRQGLIRPGAVNDFTGDGRSDAAVWRPSTGFWYVRGQAAVWFGRSGDVPVPGDYNGDGRTEIAVWRPSTGFWYVRGQAAVWFGRSGDVPVPGDYNGDGRTEIAVWRPSTGSWYVRGHGVFSVGADGDIPV